MGMFDEEIPEYVSGPQRIRRAGRSLGDRIAPGITELTGFESPRQKMKGIVNSVDLSSMASIQDGYKKMQQINPAAASAWLKDAMTVIEGHVEQQKEQGGLQGTFADTLKTAAFVEGCDINDTECRKRALKTAQEFKRGNPYVQESAKLLAEDAKGVYLDASNSLTEMAKLDQLNGLLNDIYTGWGSENVVLPVMRMADAFGLDKQTAGKMEAFTSGAIEWALKFAQQTKGAISDREWGEFRTAAAGLERTEAGNRLLIETAKKFGEFKQKKSKEMARWTKTEREAGRIPSMEAWNAHLQEWANMPSNIIHLPTDSEIEQVRKAVPSGRQEVIQQKSVDEIIDKIDAGQY